MEPSGFRIVRYSRKAAEFSIWDISDIHWTNRGISKSHLYRDLEKVRKDTYSLFFQGGDYADWISPNDKRFDPEAYDPSIKVNDLTKLSAIVAEQIISLFHPIRQKCLGFLIGNHEFTHMTRNSEKYIHDVICSRLKAPNMLFSGWAPIYFVHDKTVKGVHVEKFPKVIPRYYEACLTTVIHHGAGAANTAGGKINRLKTLVDMVEADLVMMGHVHEQFAKSFTRMTTNETGTDISSHTTMGMITGSYLRAYVPEFTSYAEVKMYQPTTLGASRARYIPSEVRLTVENIGEGVGRRGPQP